MRQLWLLAGILGGAIPTLAQDSTPPPPTFSDSVVVTPSLEEAQRRDSPATITVVDRQQIEDRQVTAVLQLLQTVPGLAVVQSGSPGTATSVFSRGTSSAQTLVLWNGMVLNDPFFGGFDWAYLDTENVERVEIVRGPLSTLYGSDAMGGVVQVLTGRPQEARVRLEAGENSYGRGTFATGFGGDSFHGDVVSTYRTGEGELANEFFDGFTLIARGEWQATKGFLVGLMARFNDAELGIPRSGGMPTPNRRQDSTSRDFALPLDLLAGPWQMEAHLSRVTTDFEFRDPDSFFSLNDTEGERLRGRVVAARDLGDNAWVGVGGEWQDNEVTNISTFGTNLDAVSHENQAAFLQGRLRKGKLAVEAALRYDDHEVFGSELSPGVGLAMDLGAGTTLRASYGEGFRAPSLGELFFPFSGNENLDAETSESYELTLESRRGPWRFTLAAFDSRQKNLIEFDLASFTNINRGRTRSQGLEGELTFRSEHLLVASNFTYLDAEDESTGEALVRRPRESGSLRLVYRPGSTSLSLTGRYVGRRPDIDPVSFGRSSNSSYVRLDLAARWQARPWLQPYGRLENLADEDYEEALGFQAPGRIFIGGLRLTF